MSTTSGKLSSGHESDTAFSTPEFLFPDPDPFDNLALEAFEFRTISPKKDLQQSPKHCDASLLDTLGLSRLEREAHQRNQSEIMAAITPASLSCTLEVGFESRSRVFKAMNLVDEDLRLTHSCLLLPTNEDIVDETISAYHDHDPHWSHGIDVEQMEEALEVEYGSGEMRRETQIRSMFPGQYYSASSGQLSSNVSYSRE